ncbi:hypothetical protein ITI46_20150 [Streptomyces oryzae]|uniref:Integral membrane protein n=1 Tax=Streptomyces oryzae TaxID=1434886 RepID=A0ABS3XF43_9ACTN|nr:hypothetical protein [Streptomyces oryzae]MBO8193958.1 hypothetical protein [Streptomyces oryzae]
MTTPPASGDPVRVLLRRHRALCECAVDPLEIAAGLEACGITDRTAARCRHRDVFSLAEELYARAPGAGSRAPFAGVGAQLERARGDSTHADSTQADSTQADSAHGDGADAGSAPRADDGVSASPMGRKGSERQLWRPEGWRLPDWCAPLVLPLLPGLLCSGTLAWLVLLGDGPAAVRAALCALGAAAVLASVLVAVRVVPRVPRAAGTSAFPTALFLCACWLTGYALYGDWLLEQLLSGGPEFPGDVPRTPSPAVPLGLTLAVAPALWCARGFALAARRRLAGCRSLGEFASGVRPLLALAVCAVAVSLPVLQWAARLLVAGPLALSGAHGASGASGTSGAAGSNSGVVGVPGDGPDSLIPAHWGAAAGAAALGVLLFAALLLAAHGFRHAATAGLAAACVLEAVPLLCVLAARLPRLAAPARPVEALVAHQGVAAVPLAVCGCAALVLLAYAATVLAGASAHHREGAPA